MNPLVLLLIMFIPLLGLVYVGWHVWVLLPFGAVWKSLVLLLGAACFSLLFYAVNPRLDALPMPLARVIYNIGTSSLIILLYVVLLFLVLDLGRLCHLVPRSWLYANGTTALCLLLVLFGTFLYGRLHYRHKVRVPLTVESRKPLFRSYRVVMASDLHLGYHNGRRELARWVDMINREQPDLILIAGDIIDRSLRPLVEEDMAQELRRLQAPVYACLGNHEYYADAMGSDVYPKQGGRGMSRPYTAADFYRDAGIHLLRDESVELDSTLVIIGRDDRTNPQRGTLQSLMTDVDHSKFTILLDHQPHILAEAERAGIDLQLSGHTHRGQVWPASWVTDLLFECSWGSHHRGLTQYYVSSGLGIWGGRFRIGTQSEYVVAEIVTK